MQEFGSTKNWKIIIWPAVLLIGVVAIPFSVFLVYVAIGSGGIQHALTTTLILLVLWFVVLRQLHTVYLFPLIQIDENFLVVCELLSKRKVYNLTNISNSKRFLKSVYFAHNGWPVMINLHRLSQREREGVWSLLGCS